MGRTVRYFCPEDPGQELYREDGAENFSAIVVFDNAPITCPRCGKAYFKWECKTRDEDDADED